MKLLLDTDVALMRPTGMPHQARRGDPLPGGGIGEVFEDGDDALSLHEVLRNIKGLSMGVPPSHAGDSHSHATTHNWCA